MKTIIGSVAGLLLLAGTPQLALAGVTVYESEEVTMELGLRMQTRLAIERVQSSPSGVEWGRDFVIRRTRMKIGGKAMSAKYYLEWRLDGTGTNAGTELGSPPLTGVENAYIQFPVLADEIQIRAGLYDQPFSRDRLTSDSKQLVVDRGLVSNLPASLGLADNAIGIDVRGSLNRDAIHYVVGAYDNRTIPSALQNGMPMVIGRLDFNLSRTRNIYQDAQFGSGSWYCIGVNAGYQGKLENAAGANDGSSLVMGVDGMIDVPAGPGRLHARTEANSVRIEEPAADAQTTFAWMLGAGYLIRETYQPVVRFDLIKDDDAIGGNTRNVTSIGANVYLRQHNLKVQADVSMASERHRNVYENLLSRGGSFDRARLQAQLDF